jgi:hypothetical protein
MGDTELSWCEDYLLGSREQVINKLVKGSDSHNYFTFINLLSKDGLVLTPEQEKQLNTYTGTFKTSRAANIKTRALFKAYDAAESDKKKEAVERIKKELF